MIELHQVAQRAKDLDRAVDFYTTVLGGELIARFEPPGLAFIRLGSARLLLEQAAPSALIYLRVPDVRESIGRLRAADVTVDTEPHRIHVDTDGVRGERLGGVDGVHQGQRGQPGRPRQPPRPEPGRLAAREAEPAA